MVHVRLWVCVTYLLNKKMAWACQRENVSWTIASGHPIQEADALHQDHRESQSGATASTQSKGKSSPSLGRKTYSISDSQAIIDLIRAGHVTWYRVIGHALYSHLLFRAYTRI